MLPGSNGDPIAHHVFETKGTHTLHVSVAWHGVATFDGPGLTTPVTVTIGDATITTTQTYPVHEVRAGPPALRTGARQGSFRSTITRGVF